MQKIHLRAENSLLVFYLKWIKLNDDQGTFQPMGGIEVLYDLSSDIDYKYKYAGAD